MNEALQKLEFGYLPFYVSTLKKQRSKKIENENEKSSGRKMIARPSCLK